MKKSVAVLIGVLLGLTLSLLIILSLMPEENNSEAGVEAEEIETEAEVIDYGDETNEAAETVDSLYDDSLNEVVSDASVNLNVEDKKEFIQEDPADYNDLSALNQPHEIEVNNNKDLVSMVAKCYFRLLSGLRVTDLHEYKKYCNSYAYNQLLEYKDNDIVPYETLEYLRNKVIANKLDTGELKEIDGVFCYPLDDGGKFPSTKSQINAYKINEYNTSPFIKGRGKKAYLDKNAVDLMDIEIDDSGITHYLCTYKGIDLDVSENLFGVNCYSKDPVEVSDSQYDVPFYSNSTNEMWCKITVNIVDGKVESMVFKRYD